jgi:hypothetical protein
MVNETLMFASRLRKGIFPTLINSSVLSTEYILYRLTLAAWIGKDVIRSSRVQSYGASPT